MPKEFSRTERVAQVIQRRLAHYIQFELKDPRLTSSLTSVTHVSVSRDMAYAKVYISVLNDDAESQKQALEVLSKAAGYMRRMLSKELTLRAMPQLRFVYDDSMKYGNRLSQIIEEAVTKDEKKRKPEDE